MKIIAGITLAAAMLFSTASGAHTASSSFVPRGPEPHASLHDRHHAHHSAHRAKVTSGKAGHNGAAKGGSDATHLSAGH